MISILEYDKLTKRLRKNPNDIASLYAIKLHVLNELETYQNYADIERFFDFIINLKFENNIELDFLISLLSQLSGEMQDSLVYTILTDTLDYMTDWYSQSSIVPDTPIANFIDNLKTNLTKKC